MKVADFVEKLESDEGEMFYLSTQEGHDSDQNPFQVPCRQLVDNSRIPDALDVAGNLILYACNLVSLFLQHCGGLLHRG